jgi:hypothetical protein
LTTEPIPPTAVVRVSPATFDPARFAEVQEMTMRTGEYLIPAIKALPGLISYYAATSPDGNVIHVSIWDTEEHARQLSSLKEMVVLARAEAENAGCTFGSITNYPIDWVI